MGKKDVALKAVCEIHDLFVALREQCTANDHVEEPPPLPPALVRAIALGGEQVAMEAISALSEVRKSSAESEARHD